MRNAFTRHAKRETRLIYTLRLTSMLGVGVLACWTTGPSPEGLWSVCWNIAGHSMQSERSFMIRDSSSAMVLSTPARCCDLIRMLLSMHQSHSSLARQFSCVEIVPPSLLMYVNADMLSILRLIIRFGLFFAKHFTARGKQPVVLGS